MALEVAGLHALPVLIGEAEEVVLDRVGVERGAFIRRHLLEESVVEFPRQFGGGIFVAVRRPPDFSDDDRDLSGSGFLQRRHEGVQVGIKHVVVRDSVVVDGRRAAVEEGECDGEIRVEG